MIEPIIKEMIDKEELEIKEGIVLNIDNGDIVVFKYPGVLSDVAKENIHKSFKSFLNYRGLDKSDIIILEEGMDIALLKTVNK